MRTELHTFADGRHAVLHFVPGSKAGMTEEDPITGDSEIWVPDGDDFYARTVARHELLHAEHDAINTERLRILNELEAEHAIGNQTVAGVDDAFVQLNYWVRGKDAQADREAVQTAMVSADMVAKSDEMPGETSLDKTVMIGLRTLAILRKLGTAREYEYGRKAIRTVLSEATVRGMEGVLDLIAQDDRRRAYLMTEMLMVGDVDDGNEPFADVERDILGIRDDHDQSINNGIDALVTERSRHVAADTRRHMALWPR
jgi:hypothetical protein